MKSSVKTSTPSPVRAVQAVSHRSCVLIKDATATVLLSGLIKKLCPTKTKLRPAETFTPHLPSTTTLPHELIDMIISYTFHDTGTLLACSMICRSWYIAARPYLHCSITTYTHTTDPEEEKYRWPKPLKKLSKLGFHTFTRRLRIRGRDDSKFSSKQLGWFTLRYFSALTNLKSLRIDHLQVYTFMPNIRKYFGHLELPLISLILEKPSGTCRQLLYFIGLFRNLENLHLYEPLLTETEESAANSTLAPPFKPPLSGLLVLWNYKGDALIKGMVEQFSGLRFRKMFLDEVEWTSLLLTECAETLEELRFELTNTSGKGSSKSNIRINLSQDCIENSNNMHLYNLSKNISLRRLDLDAWLIGGPAARDFLKTVLSTITSPLPLNVMIIYRESEVGFPFRNEARGPVPGGDLYARQRARLVRRHAKRLRAFSEMYGVRKFQLELYAGVPEWTQNQAEKMLEDILEEAAKDGGLDYLGCRPRIAIEPCEVSWAGVRHKPTHPRVR